MIKKERGNTLILVTACIGVIVLLVAFFVLNYNQLFGGQKQVANAIDAAALAAAVDIGRVVVDTPLGRVALVDDVPAVASMAPQGSSTNTSPLATDPRPIQGINTIMGTMRLDAVIAGSLGNNSITFLVGQDLARAQEAAAILNTAIKGATTGSAYDKFGNQVNIANDVQAAYNQNKPMSSINSQTMTAAAIAVIPIKGVAGTPNSIGFELGYLNPNIASTNIPTQQSTYDPQTVGLTVYKPYQAYSTPNFPAGTTINPQFTPAGGLPSTGLPGNFQFAALANQPALVDKSSFVSNSAPPNGTYVPESAVHVRAYQNASPIVPGAGSQAIVVDSYAEAGSANNTQSLSWFDGLMQKAYAQSSTPAGPPTTPSGTLEISFASGGIPGLSLPANLPAAPNNQKLEMSNTQGGTTIDSTTSTGPTNQPLFTNVMTMMNASMANPATGRVASDSPWTPTTGSMTSSYTASSPGNWYVAQGTLTNESGNLSSPGPFKSLNNTTGNDNPSVALSFIVYDWLKTLGMRPNISSVHDALALSDKSLPANTFYAFESLLTGSNPMSVPMNYQIATSEGNQSPLASNFFGNVGNAISDNWTPPAYASRGSDAPGIISALEQIGFGNGDNDPKNLGKMNQHDRQRQQQNVWGYVPADTTLSSNALLVKMSDGNAMTVDGHPMGDLYQLWGALAISAKVAQATKIQAWQIIGPLLGKLEKDNQQYQNLCQQKIVLQNQLQASPNDSGLESQLAAVNTALKSIMQSSLPQVFKQAPRAYAALVNAQYCMHVVGSIYSNFKALTGLGCQKISKTHYVIGGSDFWPLYQVATVAALKGTSAVPTGQDPSLSLADWTTAPIGKGQSQLNFYKHTTAPVVGHLGSQGDHWLAPALATLPASAPPPYENLHFCFYVSGSIAGQGQVHLYVGPDPFINTSGNAIGTLDGQALYQDTQALQTNPTTSIGAPSASAIVAAVLAASSRVIEVATTSTSTYTVWQVQARDQAANNYAIASAIDSTTNPNLAAAYFADTSNGGGASSESNQGWCGNNQGPSGSWKFPQCPALAGEWQLTCPMPASISWTTYTQYTLPPIAYSEDVLDCGIWSSEGAPIGSESAVVADVASFSVGGVGIYVVNQLAVSEATYSQAASYQMQNLGSLGYFDGQQSVQVNIHS